MSLNVLGVSVYIEVLIFVLILIVASVYVWRKGALEWSSLNIQTIKKREGKDSIEPVMN